MRPQSLSASGEEVKMAEEPKLTNWSIWDDEISTATGKETMAAYTALGTSKKSQPGTGRIISTPFQEEPLIPVDTTDMIFVFGSNEAGIHGAGAARIAFQQRGAVWKEGWWHHGTSFAIPTKDRSVRKSLPLSKIQFYVDQFLEYARKHPELTFQVTAIGCGLAGFKHSEIAPMFANAPDNCWFDDAWKPYLPGLHPYWGTF